MGSPTGFLDFEREDPSYVPVEERLSHYNEFTVPLKRKKVSRQGARCMDCGTPYCHQGCPVDNLIPDWNELVHQGRWQEAIEVLHSTNNFPEFTGRVCPAPCEEACTLALHDAPVTIKTIEYSIIEQAWAKGWIRPEIPSKRTGRRVAIVGSGPAGLACAQQLARAGHEVTVFEKNAKIGGLLRYGIPDFKLSKAVIDRRMSQMQAEGVDFSVNSHVGYDVPTQRLVEEYDAVVLAGGCEQPRNLEVPGRELDGIYFAMPYLTQQNRRVGNEPLNGARPISAEGKHVVVIGGGDTGSDCVGTANRQGALSVTQLEVLPRPPGESDKLLVWPNWPLKLRTSSSHEEGCERRWSVSTTSFSGKDAVERLRAVEVDWIQENGSWRMVELEGTEFELECDLVLLALGFVSPVRDLLLESLGVEFDERGNVQAGTDDYQTRVPGVFVAGDMRRGQSLVVWAIREGRRAARAIDEHLMGTTNLPH
jgi:glutamate synthase (NADPH/NADH) small chain